MNKANNTISSIIMYLECNNHIANKFNTENISNFKIYNKRKKVDMLNFFSRLFLFTLLICILLFTNNWDFCTSWNCENSLKKTLYVKTKRSLSESIYLKEPKTEKSEIYSTDGTKHNKIIIKEPPLLLSNKKIDSCEKKDVMNEIEEKIDIYQERNTGNRNKSERKNFMELLNMLKGNKRLFSLCGILLMTIIAFMLNILSILNANAIIIVYTDLNMISILFLSICILLTSIFLIHK